MAKERLPVPPPCPLCAPCPLFALCALWFHPVLSLSLPFLPLRPLRVLRVLGGQVFSLSPPLCVLRFLIVNPSVSPPYRWHISCAVRARRRPWSRRRARRHAAPNHAARGRNAEGITMDLLKQFLGSGQGHQDFSDFVNRFEQGQPSDGYSDQEAVDRYHQVA